MDSASRTTYRHSADSRVLVGSETPWRTVRIGELVLIAVFMLVASSLLGRASLILIATAAMLAVLTSFHQVTSGIMEADGLYVKRYLRWRKIPWEAIEGMSRSPMGAIFINIKGGNLLNGRLYFIPNPVFFGDSKGQASFDDLRIAWMSSHAS
jgi:hypothetical protein